MQGLVNRMRDKTRSMLHQFSNLLGERDALKPSSLYEAQKARESVTIDVPKLACLLPYETIDELGFYHNKSSAGFGFYVSPLNGANESLVQALAEAFKNKLPKGAFCTTLLYKHSYLGGKLAKNYAPLLERGGIVAELARMSINFHRKAIRDGYKNNLNIPAQLADYECFMFFSLKKQQGYEKKLAVLRDDWASELKVAGFYHHNLLVNDFKAILNTILSPDLDAFFWPESDDSEGVISQHLANPTTVYEVDDSHIDITLKNADSETKSSRLVNCELLKNGFPKEEFGLWQTPDLFANLLKPEHGIQCPFLISFSVAGVDSEKVKAQAKKKAKSLNANANAVQEFLVPGIHEQAHECNYVYRESAKDNLQLFPTFYNLTLFTSQEKEKEHVAKVISSFRQLGFKLIQSRCNQWLRYLGSLPFVLGEGLFNSFQLMGMTKQLSNHNVANLLPVVADFKGSNEGLVMPTYRHQLFCFDPFDDKNLPISNYNRLTVATSGAGKSYFQASQILDGVSRGHQIFIIDIGESYKHLCELLGGSYIDASTLSLNPFTLFDFEGSVEIGEETRSNFEQIRDLLAVMASPDEALKPVQNAWLLKAIRQAVALKKDNTCIDDVISALKELQKVPEYQGDNRLSDLPLLLEEFSSQGSYGHIFNARTPLINNNRLVVLELSKLSENKSLLKIVMFVMTCIIQGQFYNGDRGQKKLCIIDEGWQYLVQGTNQIAATFIEHMYRVCRKYNGGFSLITQFLKDTAETNQGQAIEACSDTKIIAKQGAFDKFVAQNPEAFNPLQQQIINRFGEAKNQGFSSLMLQFGNQYSFHRLFSDPFSRILFSTSGDEFSDVETLTKSGMPIIDAIHRVSEKYYGGGQ